MTLVKRNYKTIDNVFDELFQSIPSAWNQELNKNVPPVNIYETNDAFHLELIAPGLRKENFKVNLEDGTLTISFEKSSENEKQDYKTHRHEFKASSFKRTFTVDNKIVADKIQAKYEDGILKLLLPKKEEVKITPKEITIQ